MDIPSKRKQIDIVLPDVALVTSLWDGMNLVSYEFVACQDSKRGVLILSEVSAQFAGAAQSPGAGAILVNPWNIIDVAAAISHALNMPAEEREKCHRHNFEHVTTHTAQQWAECFLCEWLEDELELNALHNPASRCGSVNEKADVSQRTALSAALGGRVEVSAMTTISGVKVTYLLAVAFLEIIRFSSNGGILNGGPESTASRSAFSCVFEYLRSHNPIWFLVEFLFVFFFNLCWILVMWVGINILPPLVQQHLSLYLNE